MPASKANFISAFGSTRFSCQMLPGLTRGSDISIFKRLSVPRDVSLRKWLHYFLKNPLMGRLPYACNCEHLFCVRRSAEH
jgi:hypothetical protein